jgi:hypothetical protein
MIRRAKLVLFMASEFLLFALASLVHAGILFAGYDHSDAAMAEGLIGAVLALGLVGCLIRPSSTPLIALAVQVFALLGTLVGAFTIAVGIGPQIREDAIFHLVLLITLLAGLIVAEKDKRTMTLQ